MKAKFSVDCQEIGFSRSHEIPLDARGYCHELANDLDRAMSYYMIRAENHKLKQALNKMADIVDHSLLLDEDLDKAWDDLRKAVVEARKTLD